MPFFPRQAFFATLHRFFLQFLLPYYILVTIFVFMGSFAPAFRSASAATAPVTPSTSKRILPGETSNSYPCTSPFPFPIGTSAPFCVNGRSGKTRIHTLPVLLTTRAIVFRAASSWFERTRPGDIALSPYEPKSTVTPLVAGRRRFRGFLRARCHFLYFAFLGNNMIKNF